jgi:hypothetical protein
MRVLCFVTLCSSLPIVTARALSHAETIASPAHLTSRDANDDDPSIEGVKISYNGCDGRNQRTGNTMKKEISDAWYDAIKLAQRITDIDTNTDLGSFDCMTLSTTLVLFSNLEARRY